MNKKLLIEKDVVKIRTLLCSWEDGNLSDYEYVQAMGKILDMGNWTFKGCNVDDVVESKSDAGKVKDLYNGDMVSAWSDDGWTYISFPFVVLNFPTAEVKVMKEELIELCKHL